MSRALYLNETIDEEATFNVIKEIHEINNEDDGLSYREPIDFWLSTQGGSIAVALSLCDIIRLSVTPINIIATGRCYSAGIPILASGHTRCATRNTTFMIHQGSSEVEGYLQNIKTEVIFISLLDRLCDRIVTNYTKITQSELDAIYKTGNEFHFDCKKAKSWGLINKIL